MQLASRGTRVAARNVSHATSIANSSRAIHIPSFNVHRVPPAGNAKRLFSQSKHFISRFFTHLTAPGFHVPSVPTYTRFLQGSAGRATIQQGLSFPVRTALSRPMRPFSLPRAPNAVPRSIFQVGLGTARNFSSARPIFQNLAENVPVVGRAFYETDWGLKMRQEKERMQKPRECQDGKKVSSKEMLKRKPKSVLHQQKRNLETKYESEMQHYFPTLPIPNVTTSLLIPLAPTPTTRLPLPEFSSYHPSLLPLPALASLHNSHFVHALRVSTLFTRLDIANVWERGVQCSAYAHSAHVEDATACTVLKVEFTGWTKAEVRSVIGESGTGWCVLEEINSIRPDDDDVSSETSSILSGMTSDIGASENMDMGIGVSVDPSQSFILPTLDFSSFLAASSAPSICSVSNSSSRSASESDPFSHTNVNLLTAYSSDSGSDSDSGFSSSLGSELSSGSFTDPLTASDWFGAGFSSNFAERAQLGEPNETMFY